MFKMKSLHYILLAALIISCGGQSDKDDKPANFIVSEVQMIELKTTKSQSTEGLTEIKDMANYYMKVCLKDPAVGKPIIDQEFRYDLNGKSQEIRTDYDGCFTWHGDISFSMLSCESYIEENFKIEGIGNYSGLVNIPVFFNPTNKTAKAFMDGRYSRPEKMTANNCVASNFRVENIQLNRVKNNSNLLFNLTMSPVLERAMIDGEKVKIPLKSYGEYEITAKILGDIQGETRILTQTKCKGSIHSERVRSDLAFEIPAVLSDSESNYRMEIEVKSLNQPELKSFVGMIKSNDIYFTQKEAITEVEDKIEAQAITEMDLTNKDLGLNTNIIKAKEIQLVSAEDIGDEFSQNKRKLLTLNTCFFNSLSQFGSEPVANQEVTVTQSEKKDKITLLQNTTSESGCIKFQYEIDYKLFEKRNWSEREITFKIADQEISRQLQVNPWTKTLPIRDMQYSKVTSKILDSEESVLHIDNVRYGQIGNVDGSYYINRFVDLFFKKRYFLEFRPMVKVSRNFSQMAAPKSLNFGKLKVKFSLFTYKNGDKKENRDIKNINFDQLTLLSATEQVAKVDINGRYYIEPTLPVEVTDALYLSVKSIALIEVIPTQGLDGLKEQKFAFNFFGTNSNSTEPVFIAKDKLSDKHIEAQEQMLANQHAFSKGLANKVSHETDSMSLFRDTLDTEKVKYQKLSEKEFFAKAEAKKAKLDLIRHFRVMTQIEKKTPRTISHKICEMLYPGMLNYLNRKNCKEDSSNYFHLQGATHVVDTVELNDFERDHRVSRVDIIPGSEENAGSLNRGYAFMAAKGYRSSESWGTSDTTTESISASIYYDGPPSVFLMTAGVTKSHTAFNEKVNAKMHMMFTRTFTTLTPVKLNYNSITGSFKAKIKKCFILTDLKENKNNFHVCSSEATRENITEKWYFIGEADANTHGVLTDGIEVGEKANLKIIRGEKNFKKIWEMFESDNTRTVIAEMEDFNLGEKFLEYKQDQAFNLEVETNKSSSFPGLIR